MRPSGNSSNGRITPAHRLRACGWSTGPPREARPAWFEISARNTRRTPHHGVTGIQRRSARMNPNKALWEKGDFTRIADSMRESGEAVVESLGVKPGFKLLDLGCGDGTTAL